MAGLHTITRRFKTLTRGGANACNQCGQDGGFRATVGESWQTPPLEPSGLRGNRGISLTHYAGFMDNSARHIVSRSFEELAAQHGVTPIDDFESLLGKPSPEDESAEEFSANLREWRREGRA